MNKQTFIKELNKAFAENDKLSAIGFLNQTTKLSVNLSTRMVTNFWGCTQSRYFGGNIYYLLKSAANASDDFIPKVKKGCSVYLVYPDEHAAAFALFKIKQNK